MKLTYLQPCNSEQLENKVSSQQTHNVIGRPFWSIMFSLCVKAI